MLPFSRCPECSRQGPDYIHADVDLSRHLTKKQLSELPSRNYKHVPWNEYTRMASPIKAAVGKGRLIPPGCEFGYFRGKLIRKLGDFCWPNLWRAFMRVEAFEKLRGTGCCAGLVGVPAEVTDRKRKKIEIVELQVEPIAEFSPASYHTKPVTICNTCGWATRDHDRTVIDLKGVPLERGLFQAKRPGAIYCTEPVRETIERLELSNVMFQPALSET